MRPDVVSAVAEVVPDGPVAVALGGGADSAVAAWAVVASGRSARALFVHHDLAGSDDLATAAAAVAARIGIECYVLDGAVADGSDLEDRARRIRWQLLGSQLSPGEHLVAGHTATDQAETVLMNLMRGAGSRGVSAMPVLGGPVHRPLLGFSREDIRDLAAELGLPFADDPANADLRFLRNRVRHEVLPALEAVRPGAVAGLARSARLAADDDQALVDAAAVVPVDVGDDVACIEVADLRRVAPAVSARVVRRALEAVGPGRARHRDITAVESVVAGDRRRAQLSADRFAEIEGARVAIWAAEPVPPPSVELAVPGSVRFGAHGLAIDRVSRAAPGVERDVYLDPVAVPAQVTIRAARAGERIAIAGGSKLVRDALAESGVPRRLRAAWPVVVADAKIAAIPAVRAASWAAAGSGEVLRLRDERAIT